MSILGRISLMAAMLGGFAAPRFRYALPAKPAPILGERRRKRSVHVPVPIIRVVNGNNFRSVPIFVPTIRPTTAELSKARSMERKWRKAAAQYPTSPAGIANAGIVTPPF